MINGENVDNPERDLNLTNRDPRGSKRVAAAIEQVKHGTKPAAEEELQALRTRIATARTPQPDPRPHCSDCYQRGWNAAMNALEE